MVKIAKILFPVDFSANNLKIAPYVRQMLQAHDADLILLHVVADLGQHLGLDDPHPDLGRWQDQTLGQSRRQLEGLKREQFAAWPQAQLLVLVGDPAQVIVEQAHRQAVDLIVMGTHGRRGLEHVIFGSVAERVVKNSPTPVLTVNPHLLPGEERS
ncbi:MAG: universal stress protein [Pseudomonadota bacterium]